jgi:hypothetical protein
MHNGGVPGEPGLERAYVGPDRRLRSARPLPVHLERRRAMIDISSHTAFLEGHRGRHAAYWHRPERVQLTIVMPVHNEEATVYFAVKEILSAEVPCDIELIVVNDGSTDRTQMILESFDDERLACIEHHCNMGKGAAVRSAIARARGTHLLVFDADLEYDANDIASVIAPVIEGRASVVYGVRSRGMRTVFPSLTYAIGNVTTTLAANVLFDACLTDMHTCLKLVPLEVLRSMPLREHGFGLDTEITAELLRRGYRPFEVPVSYSGRSHGEGKKIRPSDGVRCLYLLTKVRLRGKEQLKPRTHERTVISTSKFPVRTKRSLAEQEVV